jgi:hypothetical protein
LKRAKERVGLAALAKWDADHKDVIVHQGGPLGPTRRTSEAGVTDVVNELTVFVVVRARSHEAAARLFEGHQHMTIFPCDALAVMPLLGDSRTLEARAGSAQGGVGKAEERTDDGQGA